MSCDNIACNQGRKCTCVHPTMHDTSELPHGGFWFGPGLACFDQDEARREPWSWLEISLAAISASGVVGFVAGIGTMWWKGLL